jgi:gliding motility-associated-like protein
MQLYITFVRLYLISLKINYFRTMKQLLFALLLFFGFQTNAAHIIGGEVYYDSLGNDQYQVTFEIYRDCNGFGAPFDNPLYFTVFDAATNTIFGNFTINAPVPDILPVIYDDPCVTPPTDICVERAIYVTTITLPTNVGGYYITYQRCCWASNIMNIDLPDDWGITLTTYVPGTALVAQFDNNAARFNEYPPIVLCSGQTLDFDHAATDPDADSLVYYMCDPLTININDGVQPTVMYSEPYAAVPWEIGFSGTVPLGTGSTITIDPQTGFMQITPDLLGTFVAAVCVDEYRDGVLINSKSRTFGYRVVECDVITPMQVDVITQGDLIEGCAVAGFIVYREDSTDVETIQIELAGTATNGVDYNFLPDFITMDAGVGSDTINIIPVFDNLSEGNESIILNVIIENICNGTFDTTTAFLTIVDYTAMSISIGDSLNLCDEVDEWGQLWCSVTNGVPPYTYTWSPISYANNDTINFPPTDLEPNLNLISVQVTDACAFEIFSEQVPVYNQCPLVTPNVITPNNDNTNDFFIVRNLEDYDRVNIKIINRWGNLIYENEDYQNDWNGKAVNGQDLTEGVYYYTVQPQSEKFEYDDVDKTLYVKHGFFYIIR